MGKSRAEYMRDYRQKKRDEKLKAGKVEPKKIARSSTQRSRDHRARVRASVLSQSSTADPTIALPNPAVCHENLGLPPLPFCPTPSTSTTCNTGPTEIHPSQQMKHVVNNSTFPQYPDYQNFSTAHDEFKTRFLDNKFGAICDVCDRLWYENNMKSLPSPAREVISAEFPDLNFKTARVCHTCHLALAKSKIPTLSKSNGFKYPSRPPHLPELDLISERLISPRLPFMAIRRLRHGSDQCAILGQVINVPVSVDNMVNTLPRDLDDDYAINVHIKRKKIYKSSYLMGCVKKRVIKTWLEYLMNQELYKFYGIKLNESLFNTEDPPNDQIDCDEFSEVIEIADSLTAQQQTLLWDENKYLCLAPGENTLPKCVLFDEHWEELSFPSIYFGQFRTFKEEIKVTPFMIATSELRRADRRGVTPTHLLYMAMKILRLRTRDTLQEAFKFIGKDSTIIRAQIESTDNISNCIENKLEFLSHIPNSAYYWAARQKDLFAMMRQLGKPTFFLTMSANEIGWTNLMKLLYKLKNDGAEIDDDTLHSLHYNSKAALINEDPVTCAIHFNKLVDTIMEILQSKRHSPFGRHYVTNFFKRIEFQRQSNLHAHILLWLNNAPKDAINGDQKVAINFIDSLVFLSKDYASGHEKLQEHKHTCICYKKIGNATNQKCRFGAPFMPSRSTVILIPMPADDPRRNILANVYNHLWKALEENDYRDIDHFFEKHNILSDEFYLDVLRAGIKIPTVFLKRQTTEKWINAFNPFILNVLGANMDFQFIVEEYSCAAYVVEYFNKTNLGISNLQRKIIEVIDEHPEFDMMEITRKLSIDMVNAVEMTSQEAAWFLLRLPMSSSYLKVIYIATVRPIERQRVRKSLKHVNAEEIDDDSTDLWQNNCFDKYERRPVELEDLTLAQATAYYFVTNNEWKKRRGAPRIIRYRNYNKAAELEEYKREMVTLHLPFRNEETEILAERKYIQLYDDNEIIIMQARKEFESNLDIAKTMEICRQMCTENEEDDQDDVENLTAHVPVVDPFRKEFDLNPDIAKTMEICRQMYSRKEEINQDDVENLAAYVPVVDPFEKEIDSNPNIAKTMEICNQMYIKKEEIDQDDVENVAAHVPVVDPFRKKIDANPDIAKTMAICRQMSIKKEEIGQDDVENLAAHVPVVDPFRKKIDSNPDIAKTMEICRQMCIKNEENDQDGVKNFDVPVVDPLAHFHAVANTDMPVVMKRENLMPEEDFNPFEPEIILHQ